MDHIHQSRDLPDFIALQVANEVPLNRLGYLRCLGPEFLNVIFSKNDLACPEGGSYIRCRPGLGHRHQPHFIRIASRIKCGGPDLLFYFLQPFSN